ncbi:MAG: VOC family protein [Undibacterium sp.]|nr:VOC family protein [Undibacterium sp.]
MEHNPVGWFEIYVQDMARARTFYESMLQLKLEHLPMPEIEMWGFPFEMERVGASGSLVKMHGVASGGNSTVVYFSCVDCAVEEARVVPSGGTVQQSKMSIGEYGFISMVLDTEGNMIGLHSIQ